MASERKGLCALVLLVLLCYRSERVSGRVLAGFVMPHGGIALDPAHFNTTNATAKQEAWELHNACKTVGEEIAKLSPDVVFLVTPHGVEDITNFMFYLNPQGFGWADTDNCGCPPCCYNVSVAIDANQSLAIIEQLQHSLKANISGLNAFGPPAQPDADPFPLRWGEVIPLHFIAPLLPHTHVMVLSVPSRRYTQSVAMTTEVLALGGELLRLLDLSRETVVVVISGDLAHTHLPLGPYGYSNASEPFDLACGRWASSLSSTALLETASGLVDRALSCGYPGFVLLHGMMESVGLASWTPSLYANYHPSYYGMMVASFIRQ